MALVSREVASYPMQGAVERPPAPTLSPVPNPFLSPCLSLCLCLSLTASLSLPLSTSPTFTVVFSRAASSLSVRPSPGEFHRSSSAFSNASNYRNPTFETKGGPF